jgi:hypothetical protein
MATYYDKIAFGLVLDGTDSHNDFRVIIFLH